MEVKVRLNCEVEYQLIGFDSISGHYTPEQFKRVREYLKEYNTDISHEIYEGTAIDKDGLVILVVITIINLDK